MMSLFPKPPDVLQVPYLELRPTIDDGDVFLWYGTGFSSRFIQLGTHSWASHSSQALREGSLVLNYESTTGAKVVDWFNRKYVNGSQTNDLSTRMSRYKGRVFYRRLSGPRTPEFREKYRTQRRITAGIPYERSWKQFISPAIWLFRTKEEDRSSLFCSELLAWSEQDLEVIRKTAPSSWFAPEHWLAHEIAKAKARVQLLPEWSLGPLVEVVGPFHEPQGRAV